MSVVVMGMEMPENCCDCPLFKSNASGYLFCKGKRIAFGKEDYEWLPKQRPNWCPLRPLPEKHGWLIDADAFKAMCREVVKDIRDEVFLPQDIEKVRVLSEVTENLCRDLDEAPAIVEAEG